MKVLLSYCLLGMGVTSLVLGVSSLKKSNNGKHANWPFVFLCLMTFVWQSGVSIQIRRNVDGIGSSLALEFIILLGTLFSLSSCVVMLCRWFELSKMYRYLIQCICGLSIMSILFFTFFSVVEHFYYLFLWFLGISTIWMIIRAILKEEDKRERYVGEMALMGFSLMVLGMVLEVVLYLTGKEVFPGSACTIFFTLIVFYRIETTSEVQHSVMG